MDVYCISERLVVDVSGSAVVQWSYPLVVSGIISVELLDQCLP